MTPEGIWLYRLAVSCGFDLASHSIPIFSLHLSPYLPTAVSVKDINKLFESFNTVQCAVPGKTLRSPLSDNSSHIGHWTKGSMGIKSWIFLNEGKHAFKKLTPSRMGGLLIMVLSGTSGIR